MAWYKTGTIAINGKEVTGSGTKWADPSAGIGEGQALLVPSSGVVKIYEIARVNGDTSMTLVSDASNLPSGSAYAILSFYGQSRPDFARQLAATLRSYQEQSDALKQFYSATGDITVEIDGVQYTGSSFQKITTELDKKADKTYVDTELDKKADKTYVDAELNKKAEKTPIIAAISILEAAANKILVLTGKDSAKTADLSVFSEELLGKRNADEIIAHLKLGDASKLNVGVASGTVAAGDVTIGVGQAYMDVTADRSIGVIYTNSSTRPIAIKVQVTVPSSVEATIKVGDIVVAGGNTPNVSWLTQWHYLYAIIPQGATYSVSCPTGTLVNWVEMR
uniref:Tail fiber n=2 Tax=Viruses TaxID=10239 RepID=E7EKQ4_9CAUD|nr:tail fiber [Edwardsiella phage eiAU]ADV36463.1 phage tail fiber [Edwardsiella phage eiDWF]